MAKETTLKSTNLNPVVSDLLWRDLIRTEKLNQRESKWGWLVEDYARLAASSKVTSRRWQTRSYQTECYDDQSNHDKTVIPPSSEQEVHQSESALPSHPQTEARAIGWLSASQYHEDKYGGTASSRPKNSILRQLGWPWEAYFKMPVISGKHDEDDEMGHESHDSDKSDADDMETDSGMDDEHSDDVSDLDDEESETRRMEYLLDMAELEKQFRELRERLYYERLEYVDIKLEEVRTELAPEYQNPLAMLKENMQSRAHVADILKELRLHNLEHKNEAEKLAAIQHYESEKSLLYDQAKEELEEKIRRLEEDRNSIDISSDLWNESQTQKKKKTSRNISSPDKRRKPVAVAGPFIVYLLKETDIIEDWTFIKKALRQTEKPDVRKRKDSARNAPRFPYNARFEEGRLLYEGEWFSKGHRIVISNNEDPPVQASITAVNMGEVWVKRTDGHKSKLYIAQLQKGKYSIQHVAY